MSLANIRTILHTKLSEWTTTPIQYDNMPDPQDSAGNKVDPPETGYVIAQIDISWTAKVSQGAAPQVRRTAGTLHLRVLSPKDGGGVTAYAHADNLVTLFRDWGTGGLTTQEATPMPGRPSQTWYVVTVSVPFEYDQII